MFKKGSRITLAKAVLFSMLTAFFSPIAIHAQAMIQTNTNAAIEFRIVPTSLEITPAVVSVAEGSGVVEYRAVAKYNYPGLPDPIADRDVTEDALTVWSIDDTNIALVNTIGDVTPVSDLGFGAAVTNVRAVYGGKTGQAQLTVTGVIVAPPPVSGGGGGGGGGGGSNFGNPPSEGGQPVGQNNTPSENPASNNNNPPPQESNQNPQTQENPVTNPVDNTQTPPVDNGEIPPAIFNEITPENAPYLPVLAPLLADQVSPLAAVFAPEEISSNQKELGTTRAFVAAEVARRFNLIQLRKELLDRCYADLNNCTNIFRIYSNYEGINLDINNLRLFPDVNGIPEEEEVNKLALLGVINGYYAIETSPFLPQRNISNVEMYKILTTVLNTMEKGMPDYKAPQYDYNVLFYKDIYAAYLVNEQRNSEKSAFLNNEFLKIAHALTREGLDLIRSQTTPFADIRPDLYDEHWYYPIVYNRLCKLDLIDCEKGTQVNPDASPDEAAVDRILSRFDAYIREKGYDEALVLDSDNDGILNIDENIIYLTNPLVEDTDEDSLNDGRELLDSKTDPNIPDTDYDGLSDGKEIDQFKTDPNMPDTDGDGYSDGNEIDENSDPLDSNSIPDDKNKNNISDRWEAKYSIDVKDGSQDTDGDGVSDNLEYKYNTNPTRIDTDMDGYTDSEEILEILSDPIDPASPGNIEDLPVVINNFQYGQIVADPSPMIKGIAPASLGDNKVQVQILLRNEFGGELLLGSTNTDARGKFVFFPEIEIKNGTYFLLARSINKGEVKSSNPVKIIIDGDLQVAQARPERLESTPISEEALLSKLVLKVDSKDGQPVLYGTLSEFGSRVNVTWQSLVVSSALIADTTDGSFSMKAPKLEPGRHTVYIQTVRKRDNALSKTIKISFDLGLKSDVLNIDDVKKNLESPARSIVSFITRQSWPFWLGVCLLVLLVSGGLYYAKLDDSGAKRKRK